MSEQPGPRHRVIEPITSGPRRGPKMGRLGFAILLLVALAGLVLLLCGPPPQPRAPSRPPPAEQAAPERLR